MTRLIWSAVYHTYAIWLGIKAMRYTQLGSVVIYKGERWTIYNWSNSPRSSLCKGEAENRVCERSVPREDFRPVMNAAELWHRMRTIRRWWLTSWHSIYVNRRIHPKLFRQ